MGVVGRYQRDLRAVRRRLASLERHVVHSRFGKIEYIDHGEGPVVLVSHGIAQGADGGLRELAADIVPASFRVIVPSRFGYLGSEMPDDATPEMQADAFAALLDAIGVPQVLVLAGSAGSTSALHFAIRHHYRTRALLLVSANVPGPHQSKGMPPKAVFRAIFASDPILWLILTYAPGLMARLSQVLRVPDGVEPTEEDEAKIRRAMEGVLLGKLRVTGALRCVRVEPRDQPGRAGRSPGANDGPPRAGRPGTSVSRGRRHGSPYPVRASGHGRRGRSSDAGGAPCGAT